MEIQENKSTLQVEPRNEEKIKKIKEDSEFTLGNNTKNNKIQDGVTKGELKSLENKIIEMIEEI